MRRANKGFTLIEMILVMGLLATVMAIVAPRLSRFFAGRDLTENARRVLELTFYARSEAISRAVPMELWLNPESGEYGVRPSSGFEYDDKKPVQFILPDDLAFEVDAEALDEQGVARLVFEPDGLLDTHSLASIRILETDETGLEIVQSENKLGYVVRSMEQEQTI